jgi:hypothetical protein
VLAALDPAAALAHALLGHCRLAARPVALDERLGELPLDVRELGLELVAAGRRLGGTGASSGDALLELQPICFEAPAVALGGGSALAQRGERAPRLGMPRLGRIARRPAGRDGRAALGQQPVTFGTFELGRCERKLRLGQPLLRRRPLLLGLGALGVETMSVQLRPVVGRLDSGAATSSFPSRICSSARALRRRRSSQPRAPRPPRIASPAGAPRAALVAPPFP